jgi:AraC family transcriptional regulator
MNAAGLFIPGSAGETYGQVIRTRRTGRFVFRESRYRESLRMPRHYHPEPYFSYIAEGDVSERGGCEIDHGPGSVHFHPAGDPHSVRLGRGGATCVSIILPSDLAQLGARRGGPPRSLPMTPASWIARRCQRELRATDSASDLALEALALELVAALLRAQAPGERTAPRWLHDVRDHLHAHCLERVRLADLSALAGIHEVHLVRAFRRHFGATPGAYVRELRIEHARLGLGDRERPIADLALEAGFSSQAHFTRVFHRLVGTTPAAYRRSLAARRSG